MLPKISLNLERLAKGSTEWEFVQNVTDSFNLYYLPIDPYDETTGNVIDFDIIDAANCSKEIQVLARKHHYSLYVSTFDGMTERYNFYKKRCNLYLSALLDEFMHSHGSDDKAEETKHVIDILGRKTDNAVKGYKNALAFFDLIDQKLKKLNYDDNEYRFILYTK